MSRTRSQQSFRRLISSMLGRVGSQGFGARSRRRHASRRAFVETLEERRLLTGSWQELTDDAPNAVNTMLLLSDGTVMVNSEGNNASKDWRLLTPDSSGSYADGSWTDLADMSLERLFFGSVILQDGKVLVVGGEYSGPATALTEDNTGEIYDPVADSWSDIADYPTSQFGDGSLMVLPDGRVLGGDLNNSATQIYNPATDTWALGGSLLNNDTSSEESWVKLPDDSILTYAIRGTMPQRGQRYLPGTNQWVDAGAVPVQLDWAQVGFVPELGPGILLYDGRAFFVGAGGAGIADNTAFYTPPATLMGTGSWAAGPNIPSGLGSFDGPGAVLPNGHVIFSAGTQFTSPTTLFEFDPGANTITTLDNTNGPNLNVPCFTTRMLVLPSGELLFSSGKDDLFVFTPDGGPNASWRPTISSIVDNGGGEFVLQGTQLNGLTEGAYYGDDAQMASNYPIVRINDGGNVYYARSHDWSSTSVATGNEILSTLFDLPGSVVLGAAPVVDAVAPSPSEGALLDDIIVATFTDPDGAGAAGDYAATIQWGDGSITNASITGPDGGGEFTIRGSHTYNEESGAEHADSNPYQMTVAVTKETDLTLEVIANGIASTPQSFGPVGHDTVGVSVADPAVVAVGGQAIASAEGSSTGSVLLATFTDPGGPEAIGDYSADINWGDGTGTQVAAAAITLNGSTFEVRGSHTYAEESAADHPGSNPYSIMITIHHESTTPQVVLSTATVSDPDVVAVGGQAIAPVEGASTGSVLLATFTDPGGPEAVGDYSADINWGDGTGTLVGAGAITLNGSTFEVRGSHTYAEESAADHPGSNPYSITITIHHESTTPQVVMSTATVSDPAVVPVGGFTVAAVEGMPSGLQTVATFTDPGGPEPLGDYSALIDWGDGTPATAGIITFAAGVYTVQGSHTYAVGLGLPDDFGNTFCDGTPPYYLKSITVSVSHEAAPLAQAVSEAKISIEPGTAHLAGGSLIVVGTSADDHILINPAGATDAVSVALNSQDLGSFVLGPGGRIIVAGLSGEENIQVAGAIDLSTVLYGGPGNDRLKGGKGPNILVGCEGADMLIGGRSRDLLIGGLGADRLIGGAGADILVASNIVDPILLTEDVQYSHLVDALNGGAITADDDGEVDVLTGSAGVDEFFFNYLGGLPLDIVTDKAENAFDV